MPNYTLEQINDWLFANQPPPAGFPASKLNGRAYIVPTVVETALAALGDGAYSSRMLLHRGGITDIHLSPGKKGAVATSNNGDLLTGCGFAIAKAVVNATGAELQQELYNRFGVPGVMKVPKASKTCYKSTEGRGYAISCDSYEMKESHNGIGGVEVLVVPMEDEQGVVNMYYEALVHSKDLDYLLLPMAGTSHPVLKKANGESDYEKSAQCAIDAFAKFQQHYPQSNLKVIFTLFNNEAVKAYQDYARYKDTLAPAEPQGLNKDEIHFNQLLEQLRTKCEKAAVSDNPKVADAAGTLYHDLRIASETYFHGEKTEKNYINFKKSYDTATTIAKQALPQDRVWAEFFAKLALVILTVGIVPIALAIHSKVSTGSWRFNLFKPSDTLDESKNISDAVTRMKPECG